LQALALPKIKSMCNHSQFTQVKQQIKTQLQSFIGTLDVYISDISSLNIKSTDRDLKRRYQKAANMKRQIERILARL
jgi:hypothetical protein